MNSPFALTSYAQSVASTGGAPGVFSCPLVVSSCGPLTDPRTTAEKTSPVGVKRGVTITAIGYRKPAGRYRGGWMEPLANVETNAEIVRSGMPGATEPVASNVRGPPTGRSTANASMIVGELLSRPRSNALPSASSPKTTGTFCTSLMSAAVTNAGGPLRSAKAPVTTCLLPFGNCTRWEALNATLPSGEIARLVKAPVKPSGLGSLGVAVTGRATIRISLWPLAVAASAVRIASEKERRRCGRMRGVYHFSCDTQGAFPSSTASHRAHLAPVQQTESDSQTAMIQPPGRIGCPVAAGQCSITFRRCEIYRNGSGR